MFYVNSKRYTPFFDRHFYHVFLCDGHTFAYSTRNIRRLTQAHSYFPFSVPNYSQSRKSYLIPSLCLFRHTVKLHDFLTIFVSTRPAKCLFNICICIIHISHLNAILELQPSFSRSFCKCLHPTMIAITPPVKYRSFNLLLNSLLPQINTQVSGLVCFITSRLLQMP